MSWRLDELGWLQFEELVQAMLKARLGLGIEAWGGSGDFGKDAFYRSALPFPVAETANEGPFVFQVKFVTGANAAGASPGSALRSAVRTEVDRIAKRIAAGTWTSVCQYVLCTNVPVGDALRTEVAELLGAGVPGVEVHVLGYRDLCTALDAQPEIRLSYPEILGLRDLKGLLRQQQLSGVLTRSTLAIEIAEHNASSFVRTSAFTKAREKLEAHRFVVLSGPPEAGKTTVARMLGLGSLTLGTEVFECRSPDDVFDAYDPESDQLFIADDAFGSTEFRVDQAEIWGNDMERLLHSVDARHRLIWTSRSAILNAAVTRMHLQGRGAMFPKLGEVEVDVSEYTNTERALMLRRHARASGLDATGREVVKLAARRVVDHEHFTPQRIKRFVDEGLLDVVSAPADLRAELLVEAIHKTIREPTAGMRQSLGSLDEEHRRVLTAMIDVGSKSATATALRAAYTAHGGADDFDQLLSDLTGHFLRRSHVGTGGSRTEEAERFEWVHPSWRDLLIDELVQKAASRRAFLARCGVSGLLLAMSTEGGVSGERHLPLLSDAEDVAAVRGRIVAVIADDIASGYQLLDAAAELRSREVARRPELGALVAHVMTACRNAWDAQSSPIPSYVLATYWRLSVRMAPLAPSPQLDATWAATQLSDDALRDVRFDMSEQGLALERHLRFAELVKANEPRFLQQKGFPEQNRDAFDTILDEAKADIDAEWLVDDAEGYESWVGYLSGLADTVDRIGSLVPAVNDRAREIAELVRTRQEDVEEEARSREERRLEEAEQIEAEVPPRVSSPAVPEEAPEMRVNVSVSRILEDL